jgi:two-component system CheB/CheR fusion protein
MINILIVDDLVINRQDIIKRLKNLNEKMNIFQCSSGIETFNTLNNNKIDLILLDIFIPNMDGFEICKKIRASEDWKFIPVIMITSYKNEQDIKRKAIESGADSYITRPINTLDLQYQVKIAIRLKKAEDKIRKKNESLKTDLIISENKYSDLFNTMLNGFAFFEIVYNDNCEPINYVFKETNPAFLKIINKKQTELINFNIDTSLPEMSYWICHFNDVVLNDEPKQFVEKLYDTWYNVLCYKSKNNIAIILTDLTQQINNNNKVTKISKELDQVLNSASPLCVILDDDIIYLVNESFCDLFNIKRQDVIGKKSELLFNRTIKRKSNVKTSIESSFKLNNDKIIKCLINIKPFENYNNIVVGSVLSFTDISKIKRIENKLIKAKKKAEESDKLKSAFLSNMSHEIRSPMNSILGFSDLLLDNDLDNNTKDTYLTIIQNAGTDLLKLIDDIIDIAKIEANQIKLKYESVALNQLLTEIYMTLKENSNLKANNVNLNLFIDSSVTNDIIFTDGLRLKQVLINIINNAIKFTHSGHIDFGYIKKNNTLEFFIKDTGIGLTKEQINIIWERFRQADDSTTKKYGGTGLGLSISKGLINLLGGEIWVNSEYGKGTNFYFTISYIESSNNDDELLLESKNNNYNWQDYTILIAEDIDTNYYLLVEYLKYTNVKLIRAKTGKEAVALYRKNKSKINLILMDIQMPVMTGYVAISKIRKINSDVNIIVQSAYAMTEDIKKCFDYGCDDYITKPIVKNELLKKINNLLFK